MHSERRDNSLVLKAVALQNNGHHTQAAALFQRAGNQERPNLKEKRDLWDAAARARKIAASD